MAKKAFLKDHNDIEILPITRGELVLDSSGNPAFSSNEFLATTSQPGLMSAEDKYKIANMQASSVANALTLKINNGSVEGTNLYTYNGSAAKTLNIVAGSNVTLTPSANTLTIAANLPDTIDAYTKIESDNRYLKLDGGYMNVNASINFKHYSASVGGGGWAHAGIGFYDRSGDIRFGGLSAHGNDDKLVYIYLGTNAYNGLNLRIDSKNISWGDNHLLHLGSTACPIVFDQNYTNNTDADTLIRAGFYINTTGNGSGNSHFPKGEGYGRLFSWGDQYARVQMYAGTENGDLYFRSGSYSLVDKEWKRIAFDTSTVASAYRLITDSTTAMPNTIYASASSNNVVFGYDTAKAGFDTYLAGKSIWLRIFDKEDNLGGLYINSSSNVTIGGSDFAGTTYKLYVTGNVKATSFIGNLDGQYINALTNYAKATSISAIATTDSLNTALGKLEYKADTAYALVAGAYDGDGTIENLAEILKVLEGISDTETIQAIVGKYLPLTGGTVTGMTTIQRNATVPLYINSVGDIGQTLIRFRINGSNASSIGVHSGEDALLRYNSDLTVYHKILDTGNTGISNGTITINGTSITPLTSVPNHNHDYLPLAGGNMNGDAIVKFTTYGNRFLKISGNSLDFDYSTCTGGWAGGIFLKDSKGVEHSILQWDGGTEGLKYTSFNGGNVGIGTSNPQYKLDVNGTARAHGFIKSDSSDSYLLLGGGGHKAISDFMLKSDELTNNLTTITKTLAVTKDWMDTGIKHTDLTTGTYVVQVSVHDSTDGIWYGYWSGVMSWYGSETNHSDSDEIILHKAGHAVSKHIYLRTMQTIREDGRHLRLQIAASTNLTSATYTFKFKKLI